MAMLVVFLLLIILMGAIFVWVLRRAEQQQAVWDRSRMAPLRPLPQMTETEEGERWEDLRRRLEERK